MKITNFQNVRCLIYLNDCTGFTLDIFHQLFNDIVHDALRTVQTDYLIEDGQNTLSAFNK